MTKQLVADYLIVFFVYFSDWENNFFVISRE